MIKSREARVRSGSNRLGNTGNYATGKSVLENDRQLSSGTSHVCKDDWRARANSKELKVVRTKVNL